MLMLLDTRDCGTVVKCMVACDGALWSIPGGGGYMSGGGNFLYLPRIGGRGSVELSCAKSSQLVVVLLYVSLQQLSLLVLPRPKMSLSLTDLTQGPLCGDIMETVVCQNFSLTSPYLT